MLREGRACCVHRRANLLNISHAPYLTGKRGESQIVTCHDEVVPPFAQCDHAPVWPLAQPSEKISLRSDHAPLEARP